MINVVIVDRFIRSYLRFAPPTTRLEEVATDAALQEKSLSELQRLADILHDGVEQAHKEHNMRYYCLSSHILSHIGESHLCVLDFRVASDPDYSPERGPVLLLSGVTVPVQSFKARLEELQALADCLPASREARKRYRMVTRAKPVNWTGVRWAAVDDARLLIGAMEHGIGNWDSIRDDPDLNLSNKVSHYSIIQL